MDKQTDLLHKTPATCGAACQPKGVAHHQTADVATSQVKEFFTRLFDTTDWPARWHCGTWNDFHGWLYICSDLAIWTAYFAIPVLLFRIIRNRRDIPFPKILWLFIAFILLCGTTHLIDAVIFWWPAYRLSALIRFLTGIVSLFTVYALYKILPFIYRLRTLDQLEAEITERKKAEEETRHQQVIIKATEDLMAKKDQFMSMASHELKTPLTTIKSYIQLLLVNAQRDEDKFGVDALTRVERQANKMSALIQNILDNARLAEGKFTLQPEAINVHELLVELLADANTIFQTHDIVMKDCEDTFIYADRYRIGQVIENLISNAVKYSPKGSTITISCKITGEVATLTITDQGIGINAKDQEKLFERFYRVENDKTKNVSGFGIGLYLAAEILHYHNSDIFVDSQEGEGSSFYFSLPIAKNFS